tara:strand:+ start:354 stop:605 length:252 start_codon:yes stop_codon:yes gene_type:complete
MAKDVSRIDYQTTYDEIPYHIKSNLGLPVQYYELNSDQIRFLDSFMEVTRTLILENFEEEKKNIRFLAQEMTAACSALIEESK